MSPRVERASLRVSATRGIVFFLPSLPRRGNGNSPFSEGLLQTPHFPSVSLRLCGECLFHSAIRNPKFAICPFASSSPPSRPIHWPCPLIGRRFSGGTSKKPPFFLHSLLSPISTGFEGSGFSRLRVVHGAARRAAGKSRRDPQCVTHVPEHCQGCLRSMRPSKFRIRRLPARRADVE